MAMINARIIATLIVTITDLESAINALSTRNVKQGKVMGMKLYVLTVDGYTEGYGSQVFLVGVFDSLEKAEEAQNSLDDEICQAASIDEVLLNENVPLTKDEWGDFHNIHYLGGYCE